MLKQITIILGLAISAAPLATAKDKPAPQVTIQAPVGNVTVIISKQLQDRGYRIDQLDLSELTFSKEASSGKGMMVQAMVGNSNCQMPRQTMHFYLIAKPDSVTVIGHQVMRVYKGIICQQYSDYRNKHNDEAMAKYLADLKSLAETPAPTSTPADQSSPKSETTK